MLRSLFMFLAGCALFLTIGFGINYTIQNTTTDVYTGKVLLTENEYVNFKEHLASSKVTINEITVASSAPALVEFSVTVPEDYKFPFGELNDQPRNIYVLFVPFGIALTFGILGMRIREDDSK